MDKIENRKKTKAYLPVTYTSKFGSMTFFRTMEKIPSTMLTITIFSVSTRFKNKNLVVLNDFKP